MLICTDFSEPAAHAARYGGMLARQYGFEHITLLHAYQTFIPPVTMPLTNQDDSVLYTAAVGQLKKAGQQLAQVAGTDISIEYIAEDISLDESIDRITERENSDIVVMGISGRTGFARKMIGSTTLRVSQHSQRPLLAVPANAVIEPVKNILVACDLKNVDHTIPLATLDKVLALFAAPVTVLNVGHAGEGSPDTPLEMFRMHGVFDKYQPLYTYSTDKDIPAGILDYAETNSISLIVVIPKSYNFFENLFHKSTTKELIYNSSIPVLTLHAPG